MFSSNIIFPSTSLSPKLSLSVRFSDCIFLFLCVVLICCMTYQLIDVYNTNNNNNISVDRLATLPRVRDVPGSKSDRRPTVLSEVILWPWSHVRGYQPMVQYIRPFLLYSSFFIIDYSLIVPSSDVVCSQLVHLNINKSFFRFHEI